MHSLVRENYRSRRELLEKTVFRILPDRDLDLERQDFARIVYLPLELELGYSMVKSGQGGPIIFSSKQA